MLRIKILDRMMGDFNQLFGMPMFPAVGMPRQQKAKIAESDRGIKPHYLVGRVYLIVCLKIWDP